MTLIYALGCPMILTIRLSWSMCMVLRLLLILRLITCLISIFGLKLSPLLVLDCLSVFATLLVTAVVSTVSRSLLTGTLIPVVLFGCVLWMASGTRIRPCLSSWIPIGCVLRPTCLPVMLRCPGVTEVLTVPVPTRCMALLRTLIVTILIGGTLLRVTIRPMMVFTCRGIVMRLMRLTVSGVVRLIVTTCYVVLPLRCGRRLSVSTLMCALVSPVRYLIPSPLRLSGFTTIRMS